MLSLLVPFWLPLAASWRLFVSFGAFLAAQPVHSSLVAPLAAVLPQRKHAGPGHQVTIKSLESRCRLKSSHWVPLGCNTKDKWEATCTHSNARVSSQQPRVAVLNVSSHAKYCTNPYIKRMCRHMCSLFWGTRQPFWSPGTTFLSAWDTFRSFGSLLASLGLLLLAPVSHLVSPG